MQPKPRQKGNQPLILVSKSTHGGVVQSPRGAVARRLTFRADRQGVIEAAAPQALLQLMKPGRSGSEDRRSALEFTRSDLLLKIREEAIQDSATSQQRL